VCTLQCASAAARAVPDVPSAIAAAKHTNAQAKARELTIIFVNFVFIVVVSFCLSSVVLAFFDLSS
jgi:t-SNARE complex subunit (syntaxin)